MSILTGRLGDTPAVLGFFCLAYVPLTEETPIPPVPPPVGPSLGGDWEPPWKKKDRLEKKKDLQKKEEEDMMAVMLTILSTE